jgi:hypothetical protein
MDSMKDFKGTTLSFDTPIPVQEKTTGFLVNSMGYGRAGISGGVVKIQTKKQGERVNRNVSR